MLLPFQARLITPFVLEWMKRSSAVSVLHVFDKACNLVNGAGEVVSLVTADVGPGPFAVVMEPQRAQRTQRRRGEWSFQEWVRGDSAVLICEGLLKVGCLSVATRGATVWYPKPAWERVRPSWASLGYESPGYPLPGHPSPGHQCPGYQTAPGSPGWERWMGEHTTVRERLNVAVELILKGITADDLELCCLGVRGLAGVGEGLTPAGDDFLLGVIYALWATWPDTKVEKWVRQMVGTAVPYTTTLSAAWLKAAARGEAGEVWHQLVEVLSNQYSVFSEQLAVVERILASGHTSGAAAWAGFVAGVTTDWERNG